MPPHLDSVTKSGIKCNRLNLKRSVTSDTQKSSVRVCTSEFIVLKQVLTASKTYQSVFLPTVGLV